MALTLAATAISPVASEAIVLPKFLKGPKAIPYRTVFASQTITETGDWSVHNGGSGGGETVERWGPFKNNSKKGHASVIFGPGDSGLVTFAAYSRTGFETQFRPDGTLSDCAGPIPAVSFAAMPIGASIVRGKKRHFSVRWVFGGHEPNDDCSTPYAIHPAEITVSGGKQQIGDKKLVLTSGGTDVQSGTQGSVTFSHTISWNVRIVLKRGAAVAG